MNHDPVCCRLQCYTNRQSSANCCIGSRLCVAPPLIGLLHEERRCTAVQDNQPLIDMHREYLPHLVAFLSLLFGGLPGLSRVCLRARPVPIQKIFTMFPSASNMLRQWKLFAFYGSLRSKSMSEDIWRSYRRKLKQGCVCRA